MFREEESNFYKVNTDEAFFTKFRDLGMRIAGLSATFQNEDVVMTEEEVLDFEEEMDMAMIKLDELRYEATTRFKLFPK